MGAICCAEEYDKNGRLIAKIDKHSGEPEVDDYRDYSNVVSFNVSKRKNSKKSGKASKNQVSIRKHASVEQNIAASNVLSDSQTSEDASMSHQLKLFSQRKH